MNRELKNHRPHPNLLLREKQPAIQKMHDYPVFYGLFPFLFRFAAVRRMMFRVVSQTAIKYPQSPLSHGPAGTVRGGERLPWVQFRDSNGNLADNFSSLATREWQLHRYGDGAPTLQGMCDDRGLKLHVFPWNSTAKEAGLRKNAVYVVRPDGYVWWATDSSDADEETRKALSTLDSTF